MRWRRHRYFCFRDGSQCLNLKLSQTEKPSRWLVDFVGILRIQVPNGSCDRPVRVIREGVLKLTNEFRKASPGWGRFEDLSGFDGQPFLLRHRHGFVRPTVWRSAAASKCRCNAGLAGHAQIPAAKLSLWRPSLSGSPVEIENFATKVRTIAMAQVAVPVVAHARGNKSSLRSQGDRAT